MPGLNLHIPIQTQTIQLQGHRNELIDAYVAKPSQSEPFASVIVAHHMPGWDEWCIEVTRRLAHHGYLAICPNLHDRFGPGTAAEMSARVRDDGGQRDEFVVGDLQGTLDYLRNLDDTTGKVGIIGFCSGGRVSYMAAAKLDLDAAVDCWGGNVIPTPDRINENQPTPVIEMTKDITCPILGLFGNDDGNPDPVQVDAIEAELNKHSKEYEFHRYDGAGHAFFNWAGTSYRPEQAADGWQKVFDFYGKHLGSN
ncbi:MAG: carboxymethylenebutenolidase [Chloroflexi bacterium]|nr:carboxymethylenebutenolidase [Chloroflexota bacterium]|tara:strand:+ start:7312 stop:8070 length:759 start_codon:yes stop_codon:yes gene_type:complete